MEAFQKSIGFIRSESVSLPKVLPANLEKVNECLLDHFLWFLPVPRGFAANQEPALHLLQTRRFQKALDAFCDHFGLPKKTTDNFSEGLTFLFEKCPSLESMVFRKHDAKVVNAWIYLMVHHKNLVAKIGPKNDYEDPLFLIKTAHLVPGFTPDTVNDWNQDTTWIALWTSLLRNVEETSFYTVLADLEVTALPDGAIAQNHFVANQCCDDATRKTLEAQRQPLQDLGLSSKIANLDSYFWVDPQPVYLDSSKTFRVIVYNHASD